MAIKNFSKTSNHKVKNRTNQISQKRPNKKLINFPDTFNTENSYIVGIQPGISFTDTEV